MKKVISKIIGLSHISVLGGHLQFGLSYIPDCMWSRSQTYSRFAISLGPLTFILYANSKSVTEFSVELNGTTHEIEFQFDNQTIRHKYRKQENGNSNFKCTLLLCWKENMKYMSFQRKK